MKLEVRKANMRDDDSDGNSFAMARPAVNTVVAALVVIAGAIYYSFIFVEHVDENTVFALSNVHDLSDALLAPIITFLIVLLFKQKTLGRFLGYTYLVFLIVGIVVSITNSLIFDRFGFTKYEVLPRVMVTLPTGIVLLTVLVALFVAGEAIVRKAKPRKGPRAVAK